MFKQGFSKHFKKRNWEILNSGTTNCFQKKYYLYFIFKEQQLLHSGLNPAWHSCCLKIESVENILGYIREQFYRFSRGCKPRENLWNCSRKYTKIFKTDSFLDNKKLSFNQNVWRDHATMQQDVLLHFWVIFLHWNQAEIWKKIFCCPALELFHCLPL